MLRKGQGLAREPAIVFIAVTLSSSQESRRGASDPLLKPWTPWMGTRKCTHTCTQIPGNQTQGADSSGHRSDLPALYLTCPKALINHFLAASRPFGKVLQRLRGWVSQADQKGTV